MWQRLALCGMLVGLGGGLSACTDEGDLFGGTPEEQTINARPEVTIDSVIGDTKDITMEFVPYDEEGSNLTVTVAFSNNGGESYQFCTPAAGSNPMTDLPSGEKTSFLWDSATDAPGTTSVILRFVANDGTQEGYPELTEEFDVTNDELPSSGGGGGGGDVTSFELLNELGGVTQLTFDDDGVAELTLNDGSDSSRDNTEENFFLVVVNNGDAEASYTVDTVEDTAERLSTSSLRTSSAGAKLSARSRPVRRVEKAVSPFREEVREWAQYNRLFPPTRAEKSSPSTSYVVGQTRKSFFVSSSLDDDSEYATTTGVVAAVGEYVVVFIDEDVPIDMDYDCSDSTIDEPDSRNAYGFDTCDLAVVVDIFDLNIVAHLHDYFGEESDVDESGLITILITPILNQLTITDSSSDNDDDLIEVLADPEVDLSPYDAHSNPGSNYQEMIYLYAPDPGGFYNPRTGGNGEQEIAEYLSVKMAANIAIKTENLISYNAHFLEGEGDAEEDWLNDGLGLLAADLTGFGSVVYDDVAYYLDAPYLFGLTDENSENDVNDRGAQYLFCRYLVDVYGTDILASLMTGDVTGADNIEQALQQSDPDASFDQFVLDFMIMIALDGDLNQTDGTPLVGGIEGFDAATTIPPGSTEYYGADGFQQGINIRGANTGRTRDEDGEPVDDFTVVLNGADHTTFATGVTYTGYVVGGYSVQFTRIGGLLNSSTELKLTADAPMMGAVVRLNNIDPEHPPILVENVFGSVATSIMPFELFEDGSESVALGEVDPTQAMFLVDGSEMEVKDTDLYAIDLSGFSSPTVRAVFTVDRSMTTSEGGADLDDVMLAIVPRGDLPVADEVVGSYTCNGAEIPDISYPNHYLEYLYYQYVLQPADGASSGFDPFGAVSEQPASCNFDYDAEALIGGFLQNDEDEPQPSTLVDQIWTYQVQHLGGESSIDGFFPYTTVFLDRESIDSDDEPTYYLEEGLGGYNVTPGEEALLVIDLPAGSEEDQYVLVVGGIDSTGPYELQARVAVDQ